MEPKTLQGHIDQLVEDGKLRPDSGYRLPLATDIPPNPEADERVVFKVHFDQGFSFPPSKFMMDVLPRYNAQPHNFPPNNWLCVCAYIALCEGYLGIPPSMERFEYFFQIKKESIKSQGPLAICGSISFKFRGKLNYPEVTGMSLPRIGSRSSST